MRLDQITQQKDAQGRLTGVTATRAPTQVELAERDREARIVAIEAALKAHLPGVTFTVPAPPAGYTRPQGG